MVKQTENVCFYKTYNSYFQPYIFNNFRGEFNFKQQVTMSCKKIQSKEITRNLRVFFFLSSGFDCKMIVVYTTSCITGLVLPMKHIIYLFKTYEIPGYRIQGFGQNKANQAYFKEDNGMLKGQIFQKYSRYMLWTIPDAGLACFCIGGYLFTFSPSLAYVRQFMIKLALYIESVL